jgi:hypothetical protein
MISRRVTLPSGGRKQPQSTTPRGCCQNRGGRRLTVRWTLASRPRVAVATVTSQEITFRPSISFDRSGRATPDTALAQPFATIEPIASRYHTLHGDEPLSPCALWAVRFIDLRTPQQPASALHSCPLCPRLLPPNPPCPSVCLIDASSPYFQPIPR